MSTPKNQPKQDAPDPGLLMELLVQKDKEIKESLKLGKDQLFLQSLFFFVLIVFSTILNLFRWKEELKYIFFFFLILCQVLKNKFLEKVLTFLLANYLLIFLE